ncbi:AMP-binding protein [Rhodococcus ruber]|uniref:AMP-binding protein n=1 Tax=Rhodococcus ruber TaxID=1830 RepID=UPI003452C298
MKSPSEILPAAAQRYGDKVALIYGGRSFSFNELNDASDRIATALVDRGVRPGQTVSLFSQNRWEWLAAYHGALKAGAVVNPVNVMLTAEELAYVLSDCGSVALFRRCRAGPRRTCPGRAIT